ncbi:MAG: amidohydrolase [Luteibaculaceae bacterium]
MLKCSLIQDKIHWENPQENMKHYSRILEEHCQNSEVIILPEMFSTGFSMKAAEMAKYAESTLEWMLNKAKLLNAALCGSIIVQENKNYYNRFFWVEPNGKVLTYDKKHLFRMAEENTVFTQGNTRLIINYKGVRFCPQICYDLRFPVFSRNIKANPYDCLLYVANWPAARSDAWFSLLKARAIENLAYSLGVNRIGMDGNNIKYNGKSGAFDFKGALLTQFEDNTASVEHVLLDTEALRKFRAKFPAHLDADDFSANWL